MGIVAGCYKGFQAVTGGYRGLWLAMVWYGYKGSQVTGGYKWLQG